MYDGIKKATGPSIKKTVNNDREVITDCNKQIEIRVKHKSDMYSRENTVTKEAHDTTTSLHVTEEQDN